jgi:hypothetical protein
MGRGAIGLLLTVTLAAACTSVTEIRSTPEGALVSIDGVPQGRTPLMWSDRVTVFTHHAVTLQAPGFAPLTTEIGATRTNLGKIGASIITLPPISLLGLLVYTDYPLRYDFLLVPQAASQAPSQAPAQASPTTAVAAPAAP